MKFSHGLPFLLVIRSLNQSSNHSRECVEHSFRIAAEIERTKWKQFRSYLDKKVRKMFDQMYDCDKLPDIKLVRSKVLYVMYTFDERVCTLGYKFTQLNTESLKEQLINETILHSIIFSLVLHH
jgi:hypothetical protein